MHDKGHDAGGEHIILHVRVPRCPHLFRIVELHVVLGDLLELGPVRVGRGRKEASGDAGIPTGRRNPVSFCAVVFSLARIVEGCCMLFTYIVEGARARLCGSWDRDDSQQTVLMLLQEAAWLCRNGDKKYSSELAAIEQSYSRACCLANVL
jgi:hypothetical protein